MDRLFVVAIGVLYASLSVIFHTKGWASNVPQALWEGFLAMLAIGSLLTIILTFLVGIGYMFEREPPKTRTAWSSSIEWLSDGSFRSLRWDKTTQEYRWLTNQDLIQYIDPDTEEIHHIWPDEQEELAQDIRKRRAEEWYEFYPYSREWCAYCEDNVEPGSPQWMAKFPYWKDKQINVLQ